MKCDCGYDAFYYEKITDNKRFNVYKCGHVAIDTKRKTKCDMNIIKYVSDITQKETKTEEKCILYNQVYESPEEKYRKDLYNYINLCDITKNFSSKYRFSYIANINFILNKLGFPLYFEEKETLESLKTRVKCKSNHKLQYKPETKIILVEVPDYLAVNRKSNKCIKKSKKKNNTEFIDKVSHLFINEDEPYENTQNKKEENLILDSDSESENDSEEDNTFDVDNYDSENDYEDLDDGGAFSD
tara:strand:- start:7152 stop:7880 length:729 start_codon:yes stop_codon:yes gene_type:complete